MAAGVWQRLKLIYLLEILRESTDEDHPLSAHELCDKLAERGISAERKAIYDDIEALIFYGFDIIKTRTPRAGYFLASREFEIPEIYLLQDAVRSVNFISAKKSRELVAKLNRMLSRYQASQRSGIYIDTYGKCANEEIFYTIDRIDRAIANGHKITLQYSVRRLDDHHQIQTVYKQRKISPYAMVWQDDHYYLIGNYEKYDDLLHMRIDRMHAVEETEEPARPFSQVSPYRDVFDVADYTKRLFNMFGGETERIELRCDRSILEMVLDRFSEHIYITKATDTHFCFSVDVTVSPALVTWLMGYGGKIEVLAPEKLSRMITDRAREVLELYGTSSSGKSSPVHRPVVK